MTGSPPVCPGPTNAASAPALDVRAGEDLVHSPKVNCGPTSARLGEQLQAARILRSRRSLLWSLGTLWALLVGACRDDGVGPGVTPANPDMVVTSIELSPPERTIGVLGTTVWMRANALAEDGTTLYRSTREPDRFSWSSSAPDVATIDSDTVGANGATIRFLRGISEGDATISVASQGVTSSLEVTVRDRARLSWSVPIPGDLGGNIMGADGTIYLAENSPEDVTPWRAVSPEGHVLWTATFPYTETKIPAIGEDGTLYVGSWTWFRDRPYYSYAGSLLALDPGGTLKWQLEGIEGIRSSPAIGPDGTIYAGGGRHVYAVDPQGDIQWIYEREDNIFIGSSPAVAADGTIYIGAEDGLLYALNPDGSLKWTFDTDDRIRSSPSIGTDGTIYFGSHDGHLYAVHPDGTERWRVHLDDRGVTSAPAIGADGSVYVVAIGITAINPDGSVRWTYPATRRGMTPILGADGTVYVADERVYAFSWEGELLWDYLPEHPAGGSPIIGFDGTIFAATQHALIAIEEHNPANGGYTGAPWPQIRGGHAATGRAGG